MIFSRQINKLACIKFALREKVMKIKIGSYEARAKLPELLRQVKPAKALPSPIAGKLLRIWCPAWA